MVITFISPLYSARELRHQLVDSDTVALFILEPFCKTLEKIVKDTPIKTVVISKIGGMLGSAKGILVDIAAEYVKKAFPIYQLKSKTSYKAVLKQAKCLSNSRPTIKPDDLPKSTVGKILRHKIRKSANNA